MKKRLNEWMIEGRGQSPTRNPCIRHVALDCALSVPRWAGTTPTSNRLVVRLHVSTRQENANTTTTTATAQEIQKQQQNVQHCHTCIFSPPKLKLFMQPWLHACAPNAYNTTSVTRWLVRTWHVRTRDWNNRTKRVAGHHTLPPTTAA
jgi:hypothetical protein